MAKEKTVFYCKECGTESLRWIGKCPGCGAWNSMVEHKEVKKTKANRGFINTAETARPLKIDAIPSQDQQRLATNMSEFDQLVGGGIVVGSLTLIGGEPGIGKSTLLLQLAENIAKTGKKVLYVSGEESMYQIKLRAERLGVADDNILIYAENSIEQILACIESENPEFLIIDSIQTVYVESVDNTPGSVTQIRESAAYLMKIAKQLHIATFLVGHVTKEGSIAGPKILEHMVDTVLYFEGEQNDMYRILRTVKNRFGAANEIAVFEMKEEGLVQIINPSEIFLEERQEEKSGISVVATVEGTRPVLIEIQSLLAPTFFGNPRRTSSGIEHNRTALILAVLETRAGLALQNQDVYLKVVAGMKIADPAADLGIACSVASAFYNKPLPAATVVIGELGLTGEVRRVSRIEERINEARKLGFEQIFVPKGNWTHIKDKQYVKSVETIGDLLKALKLQGKQ
ncbi:DNA repair protein RadA [Culicoidibacter larvae]|uniref:DNA repair protein RadA n=1 Tax=Culicoidibacter larvae TaxID=2579976 RepID=A0A5R8QGP3_9FIRM|nr:DNA repair protein RadA [Culicoidibacter larvae]TLG77158.1 DNA repair protein RadA [Culicoidibacter larvae]